MNGVRAGFALALFGLLLLGALGTYEVWQALTTDQIGIRAGGILRANDPALFWIAFAVSAIIAAPLWIAAFAIAVFFALALLSRKAK